MNVALCCDDNFVIPTTVTLVSLFENNKRHFFHVYILTGGLQRDNVIKIERLSILYKQEIEIITIDNSIYEKLEPLGRYSLAMFYRYMLPEIVQDKKVLYLDGDVIVRHDIEGLYQVNLVDYACGVVVDQCCDDPREINRLKIQSVYFNSGVLLMNLDYWRNNDVSNKLIDSCSTNRDAFIYPDQDGLNCVLEGKVLYLNPTYNFQEKWYLPYSKWMVRYNLFPKIFECEKDPVIVHFCVPDKPWFNECTHPLQDEWLHYAKMHDFIGFKIRHRRNFGYRFVSFLQMILEYIKVHYCIE